MRFTEKLPLVARILMGLIFFVFGLNGFLHFIPQPPPPPEAAPFVMGLLSTGYFFPLLKVTEVVCGLLLLAGRYVPLALAVLAPIVINIVFFHVMLIPAWPMVILLTVLEVYLAWVYRAAYAPMLQAKAG